MSQIIGSDELIKKFNALEDAVRGQKLSLAAQAGGLVITNAAKANVKENGLIKSGTLRRSLHQEVSMETETAASVQIGTDLEYAAVHEFGGVITPKQSKYLAIPLSSQDYKDSPRNHSDLRLRKTAGGTLLLVDASGVAHYVLKTSVTIPAKPYLRPAMDEHRQEAEDEVATQFKNLILRAAE